MSEFKEGSLLKRPSVLVFMATFNGAKYLKTQLDSILCQRGCDVYLAISDDGSSDETVAILKDYSLRYPNISFSINQKNKGFTYNFIDLVFRYKDASFDFFAFSDQDDFWFENKLSRAISFLRVQGPKLYSTYSIPADKNLQPITPIVRPPFFTDEKQKYTNAIFNFGTGHNEVWNRQFMKILTSYYPSGIKCHDAWTFLIGAFVTSFVFDDHPFALYRQHENNVLSQGGKRKKSFFAEKLFMVFKENKNVMSTNVSELLRGFYGKISPDSRSILMPVSDYRHKMNHKMKLLFSNKYFIPHRKRSYLKLRILFNCL